MCIYTCIRRCSPSLSPYTYIYIYIRKNRYHVKNESSITKNKKPLCMYIMTTRHACIWIFSYTCEYISLYIYLYVYLSIYTYNRQQEKNISTCAARRAYDE